MFQTLKYLPAKILGIDGEVLGIMAFNVVAIALVYRAIRGPGTGESRRKLIFNIDRRSCALLYIVVMTIVGYVT